MGSADTRGIPCRRDIVMGQQRGPRPRAVRGLRTHRHDRRLDLQQPRTRHEHGSGLGRHSMDRGRLVVRLWRERRHLHANCGLHPSLRRAVLQSGRRRFSGHVLRRLHRRCRTRGHPIDESDRHLCRLRHHQGYDMRWVRRHRRLQLHRGSRDWDFRNARLR